MKEIILTQGKVVLVDDEDYDQLMKYKWFFNADYAKAKINFKSVYMHRFILGVTDQNILVDHKNGNKLDNRRSNLRPCNKSQNNRNHKRVNNKTGYRGVNLVRNNKFQALVQVEGRNISQGHFDSAIEAAKAYDKGARKFFGEFARLNFPDGVQDD